MKHLGDISKIKGAGLKHEDNGDEETTRSGLFIEAVRIIKEMRKATNGKYPRFACWENFPGAFSSNNGQDFRIVLQELIQVAEPTAVMPDVPQKGWPYADSYLGDGWSLAYRVLDAQYWGVPQRRRRIYLVADFRGERAREVLFEREGLRGYFTQGRTPWQGTPSDAQGGIDADDRYGKRAVGVDVYNKSITGKKSKTLNSSATDSDHVPCVIEQVGTDPYNGEITGDKSATLLVNCGMSTGRNGVIYSAGFCTEHSAKARSVGYDEERSPTLRAGVVSATMYSVENHPADSRVNLDDSGKVQTLTSRMGTGGGNVPMVMEPFCKSRRAKDKDDATTWKHADVANTLNTFDQGEARANELVVEAKPIICLQGNGIDRADTAGCNGKGWKEDTSYTLNTVDRPAVAYGLDRASFNQGQNAKFDFSISDEQQPTLTSKGPGAVAYEQTTYSMTTGDYMQVNEEKTATLLSRDYKDPACVEFFDKKLRKYIVRRLTPTECARLQGFPDRWGDIDAKTDFTDEEYRFWLDVRNTHSNINGKSTNNYNKQQMLTWYNKLHTDSAEYKMWGNGIALPCALYVIQGITDILKGEK